MQRYCIIEILVGVISLQVLTYLETKQSNCRLRFQQVNGRLDCFPFIRY